MLKKIETPITDLFIIEPQIYLLMKEVSFLNPFQKKNIKK